MNRYRANCCCVECTDGIYEDLPDGVSADDSLPWWTCCNVEEAYRSFGFFSIFFLVSFYLNFLFWYHGYALSPTSIIELSKTTTTNPEGNEGLEYGPRTTLSDSRVIQHVSLHPNTSTHTDEQEQEQHEQEPGFVNDEYYATVQLFGEGNPPDFQLIDIPLKSPDVYNQLQDYCQAREGSWWKTKTVDVSNPTNGYSLITIGDDNKQLYMYRPYSYHSPWKFEMGAYTSLAVFEAFFFLNEVPTQRSVFTLCFTNVIVLLLAHVYFTVCGYHGKGGRIIVRRDQQGSQLSNDEYIEMRDNPGFTPAV